MVVKYDTRRHWAVITQRHGSQWARVLPFCLVNVGIMIGTTILNNTFGMTFLQISGQGHGFVTLIVSFLLVTRLNTALTRYYESRANIGRMYSSLRELIMNVCVYTKDHHSKIDSEWRHDVSYCALILLRSVMALIDFKELNVSIWDIPELNGFELDYVQSCIMSNDVQSPRFQNTTATTKTSINGTSATNTSTNTKKLSNVTKYCHKHRTVLDENLRAPIRLEYLLRLRIRSNAGLITETIPIMFENRIMTNVDHFMEGYYGIRKFLTTPVPFPIIQMSRTFLFSYIFTIPLVFLQDKSSLIYHCIAVFIITYGFVGLEMIAIEIDDPFGLDDNDFDNVGMAERAFEDAYLSILHVDGPEWADKLRLRMHNQLDDTKPITEQTSLLDKIL